MRCCFTSQPRIVLYFVTVLFLSLSLSLLSRRATARYDTIRYERRNRFSADHHRHQRRRWRGDLEIPDRSTNRTSSGYLSLPTHHRPAPPSSIESTLRRRSSRRVVPSSLSSSRGQLPVDVAVVVGLYILRASFLLSLSLSRRDYRVGGSGRGTVCATTPSRLRGIIEPLGRGGTR